MSRLQCATRLWLLVVLLLGGCATAPTGQPRAVDSKDGLTIEPLANGGVRIIIATDVAFSFGSYTLNPGMGARLSAVVGPYARQAGAQARVLGYTDNVGASDFNLELSTRRAQAVEGILLTEGFDPLLIKVQGYGDTRPVASNADAAGRYRNRRVEVLITPADG